ncbi:hypothetical protein MNBD_UNCLBAC01-1291 [hydrothermal vent metagenome]|uniref:Uncharacterized protein n=1 Tax=hydrothermal vent metagenome TaxID=652676 RepID=A0A3B1D1L4_9ZZZZ
MEKQNYKKIIIGFVLILFGIVFTSVAVFYYFVVTPELAKREEVAPENLNIQEQKVQQRVSIIKEESKNVQNLQKINLNSLVAKAEKVYGPAEKSRKNGFLWIDHSVQQYVITLGAINGVLPGDYLMVYEGDKKIGQVKVSNSFDVISYVQPLQKSANIFKNDYYRVIIE